MDVQRHGEPGTADDAYPLHPVQHGVLFHYLPDAIGGLFLEKLERAHQLYPILPRTLLGRSFLPVVLDKFRFTINERLYKK